MVVAVGYTVAVVVRTVVHTVLVVDTLEEDTRHVVAVVVDNHPVGEDMHQVEVVVVANNAQTAPSSLATPTNLFSKTQISQISSHKKI